jgi:energy-coupling factor transport system ATP-binding protein
MDHGRLAADGPVRGIFAEAPALEALGLGVPQAAQCLRALREREWTVRTDVLSVDEARRAILEGLARRGIAATAPPVSGGGPSPDFRRRTGA